jgi:hypothetical protein
MAYLTSDTGVELGAGAVGELSGGVGGGVDGVGFGGRGGRPAMMSLI